MLQAETRARTMKKSNGLHRIVFSLLIGFCLFSAWSSWNGEKRREANRQANLAARNVERVEPAPRPQTTAANNQQTRRIEETLQRVARAMRANTDVNGDGKVDCIDAAVLFYQWFPNKNEVRIMLNRNTATGMNHLFNAVLIDGVWTAIEPQATFAGWSSS